MSKDFQTYSLGKAHGNPILSYGFITDYFMDRKISFSGKLLDIGCGQGHFLNELKAQTGVFSVGFDIDCNQIKHAVVTFPEMKDYLHCSSLDDIKSRFGTFDFVTLWDVIEHIKSPIKILEEIQDVLKPGGYIIGQTPNKYFNSVWETLEWKSLKWRNEHCSLQTARSLFKLLESAGYTEIQLFKYKLDSEINQSKLRKYHIPFSRKILRIFRVLPVSAQPNIWFKARRL